MRSKSKITQKDFDFIINNRGKISCRKMGTMFGVHRNYPGRIQLFHSRYGITTIQEFKDIINNKQQVRYKIEKEQLEERSWPNQIDEGIETYQHVMRRYYAKKFWYVDYTQLRKDFEELQRLRKAA